MADDASLAEKSKKAEGADIKNVRYLTRRQKRNQKFAQLAKKP